MTESQRELVIPAIENGIVIDHIPTGHGSRILEILHGYSELHDIIITLGLNLASTKIGKKDVLKIWTHDLSKPILEHIALVASGITMKRVVNFKVDHKYTMDVPEQLDNLVKCKNPNCITNFERDVATRFILKSKKERRFRCAYCERVFKLEKLERIAP